MKRIRHNSKTRQELFDNTIKHFNLANRGEKDGGCVYYNGVNSCAIGIELSKKDCIEFQDISVGVIFSELPKRLQNMNSAFLEDIQYLHDSEANFNKEGLSSRGIRAAVAIADNYGLKYQTN